jgi:hypothetical protein
MFRALSSTNLSPGTLQKVSSKDAYTHLLQSSVAIDAADDSAAPATINEGALVHPERTPILARLNRVHRALKWRAQPLTQPFPLPEAREKTTFSRRAYMG